MFTACALTLIASMHTITGVHAALPFHQQSAVADTGNHDNLEPDRPDVTNGTHIVDVGLLQMEVGGLWNRVGAGQHNVGTPTSFRVGLAEWLEARVSGDGFVSSHVFCVVSSVTGVSQGYPTISQREAETSATVRDGDSFVIGGLTQDENTTTKTKVPLLGDLPLIGQAFRTDRSTKSKTELYIVVTPRIVHRVGTRPGIVPANAPSYAPTTQTTLPIDPAAPQPR